MKGGGRPPKPLMCQCGDCQRPIARGETFCEFHKRNGCRIGSPVTGWEPEYNPDLYNKDKAIQHSHNCLAYAMGVMDPEKIALCREKGDCRFHVAGKTKLFPDSKKSREQSCSDVVMRTMADVEEGYMSTYTNKCKEGFSKIYVLVDEENDLHYVRQNPDGTWSDKPGGRPVRNIDGAGARVWAPHRAHWYFPAENSNDTELNYDSSCGYMCVPRDHPIVLKGGKTKRKTR